MFFTRLPVTVSLNNISYNYVYVGCSRKVLYKLEHSYIKCYLFMVCNYTLTHAGIILSNTRYLHVVRTVVHYLQNFSLKKCELVKNQSTSKLSEHKPSVNTTGKLFAPSFYNYFQAQLCAWNLIHCLYSTIMNTMTLTQFSSGLSQAPRS